jgi:beta-lactamase superfamily II metal-dependent hydrolase
MKKLTALAALSLLLTQRPLAQGAGLRIFFVDIGQGAGTLIVGPPDGSGKVTSLLVDGGPPGGGTTKIVPLLDTLGIAKIDYTVVTHYHIDHISGITELLQAGRVGAIAYDNGDDAALTPPAGGTRNAYLAYVAAATAAEIPRQQIQPGQVITLGPGVRATCIVAGGRLISRGVVAITNEDLNSESIALLVEFASFDYLVSGDLTGGGSTSTAKTPDVETYVGQAVGDVDVVQLNHHGSTTTSNQTFLAAVKAEVAVAQASDNNTFGHPHRETVNKYLNTPVTNLNTHPMPDVPLPGTGPVFYQPEAPVPGDDRVTMQGISAAGPGARGNGTILLQTDGATTYSLKSFDDGGIRINPTLHTYAVDGASANATTNFPPTVQAETSPMLPLASDAVTVSAAVFDRETANTTAVLTYWLNGVAQSPITMTPEPTSGVYQATIPAQPDATRVDFKVAGTSIQMGIAPQTTTSSSGYFSGVTPVASLRALTAKGEPLYTGYAARIQGTVTASAFSGASTNDDYVQDATGAVNVYKSTDGPTVFTSTAPGQTVEARGRIGFNGGRLRLDLTESVEKTTSPYGVTILSSAPAPAPVLTTIGALTANPESFEGQFFAIANVSITSGSIPCTTQTLDRFVTVSDGTGSFSLKIDDDTDIEGFTSEATFTAIGIIQQDDFLRPFDGGYNITPRSRADLGGAPPSDPPLVTIADARLDAISSVTCNPPGDFIPDLAGQLVKVRGAVTSINFRGADGVEYYIQDPTGGIDLFSTTLNAGPFAIGDTVEAIGTVTQFNGLTELAVSSVEFRTQGAAPAPVVVTLSQLGNGGAGEAFEGRLVVVNNVRVTAGGFGKAGSTNNVTVSDATGTGVLRIDSDTDIDGTPTPGGPFSVTGVVGQFDSTAPFDSGYQLFPRTLADIVDSCPAIAINGTLPDGVVGTPYSATLTASGGTAPYQFTISAGALPDGLTLSTAGVVSGTPSVAGTFAFILRAAAADTCAGVAPFTVSIAAAPGGGGGTSGIVISEFRTRGTSGTSGASDEFVEIYNNSDAAIDISGYRLVGSNNAGGGTTTARATVPPGVILPARAHYLFVNTTTTTGYSLAVPGNRGFTTGITDDGGVAILPPAGTTPLDAVGMSVGSAFKEGTTLTPLTGITNQSYQRKAGTTPGVLQDTNVNSADFELLNGVAPNVPNPKNIVLTAAPSSLDFGGVMPPDTSVRIATMKNVLLASVTLDPAVVNGADATAFSAATPSSTTLASGATATLDVTFTPGAAGLKIATLSITSSSSGSVDVALSGLAVCAAIAVSGTMPAAEFGFAYSQTLSASGGTGPYAFRVSAGMLPAGLRLDPSGVFSGTPGALGTSTFTVEARTSIGCTGTADFALTIIDTTPPALTLPGDLTATATSPAGAVVSFVASAVDLVNGSLPVACVPASGSTFPIGSTVVACAASDALGNRASGRILVTVNEPAQAGRMTGDGRIESSGVRHDFDFVVQERATGADAGAVRYRAKSERRGRDEDDRFEGVATRAVFFNVAGVSPGRQPASGIDTALFSGAGRWNGAAGYTFEAQATDAGEPGRGHDRFAITIRDAAGRVVASIDAALENGNIQSLRIGR